MNRFYLLVFLAGFGLILSFPPFPTGLLSTISLIPVLIISEQYSGKKAFWGGYAAGLLWSSGTLYWIGWATIPGLIGTLLINSLYFALFTWLQSILFKRFPKHGFMAAPFLWVAIELLASTGDTGFPWNLLGHTLTSIPELIQYASVTGVFGVSFVIVWINVLIFKALQVSLKVKKAMYYSIACLLLLIPFIQGHVLLSRPAPHEKPFRIALIQGNLDPYRRWTPDFVDSSFQVYEHAAMALNTDSIDLMIWPESASPCYIKHRYSCQKRLKQLVRESQVPLLTGAPDFEWGGTDNKQLSVYNSAFLVEPNQYQMNKYNKTKLVPFSERIPYIGGIRPVYNALKKLIIDIGDFTPGDSIVVFSPVSVKPSHAFACGICFDSVFPFLMKKFVKRGAQFLVIITNDGWFGRTSGPYQHASIAVMRAIENRRWVARCANTGISTFIDPYGRKQEQTAIYEKATLVGSVYPLTETTIFTHYGEWFARIILLVNGLVFLNALSVKRLYNKNDD